MNKQKKISGKIPPQAVDIEKAVLGAIIIEPQALVKVIDTLRPELFYKNAHRIIYRAIESLYYSDSTLDILMLSEQLKTQGQVDTVGGYYYITQLTAGVASANNIEYHCRILEQKFINRKLIEIGNTLMLNGYEDTDALENINQAQSMVADILKTRSDSVKNMEQMSRELLEHINKISENNSEITGLPTGIRSFDKRAGGLHDGDLVVIAGESSNGKTALGMNIAFNASRMNYRIGIWSLEMRSLELTIRAYSQRTGLNQSKMQLHPLYESEFNQIHDVVDIMKEQQLYIDDDPSSDYDKLKIAVKSTALKKDLNLVVIDYLQLMRHSEFKFRQHEMFAEIANDLKRLAKQLNIPIILISQLSRDKANPKPTLNRLKGSGDIENAADVVWLTWLPERYEMETFDTADGTQYDARGKGHHIIAKMRKGAIFDFPVSFDGPTTTFTDYDGVPVDWLEAEENGNRY